MWQKFKLVAIVGAALVIVCGAAYAKEAGFLEDSASEWGGVDEPFVVRDAASFTALYGWLEDEQDIDAFQFEITEPVTDFYVSVDIPYCDDEYVAFYPSVAVIGSELTGPQDSSLAFAVHGAGLSTADNLESPFTIADDMDALIFTDGRQSERPYFTADPFGFYDSDAFMLDLEPGTYTIAIWNSEEQAGPYTLRTGSTHPDFDAYTDEDWDAVNEMYTFINSGGWLGRDC